VIEDKCITNYALVKFEKTTREVHMVSLLADIARGFREGRSDCRWNRTSGNSGTLPGGRLGPRADEGIVGGHSRTTSARTHCQYGRPPNDLGLMGPTGQVCIELLTCSPLCQRRLPVAVRSSFMKLFRWVEKERRPTGMSGVRWRAGTLARACDRGYARHMLVAGSDVTSGSAAGLMTLAAIS
jgi:hypothetical protein